MNEVPRSSFIPKQTETAVSKRAHKKSSFNILTFIATVLLVSSVFLAGGTFLYKDFFIAKQLVAEKLSLEEEKNKFNDSDIARVRELDRRIMAANLLIDSHIAPTKLLDTLELVTKKNVQFTDFSFEQKPSRDVSVSLTGLTDDFKTVALQAIEFANDPMMKNSIFAEINTVAEDVAEDGRSTTNNLGRVLVGFNVTGDLSSVMLLFKGFNGDTAYDEGGNSGVTSSTEDNIDSTDNLNSDDI